MLVIGQAAVAAVIAATAWAAGAVVGDVLGRMWPDGVQHDGLQHDAARAQDASMPWPLTMALGFAVVGQLLTLAGLVGLLRRPVVIVMAIAIHVAAIPAWRRSLNARIAAPWSWRAGALGLGVDGNAAAIARPAFLRTAIRLTLVLLTVVLLTAFFLTLYPPLGFDQTMYHLPFARAFAASGGLPFLPALRYPIFPPLAEVLNAAVLMFAGDVATQAVGWVALVACVGVAYAWARDLAEASTDANGGATGKAGAGAAEAGEGGVRAAGHETTFGGAPTDAATKFALGATSTSARASGLLAAAAIVGSPIALYLAATGYVEPLLALLGGASLYAADRGRVAARDGARAGVRVTTSDDGSIATDARWLVAAGLLAGSAASVKYLGLYFVPAAALLVVRRWRTPRRVMIGALVIYAIAATAALLPCYGRLLAHTGNPVFPFYPELFGPNPWGGTVVMGPSGAERWFLVLTRLWDVTFRREAVGGLPHFSPAFVIALPVIALAVWRHSRFRLLLLIAIGYLLAAPTHAHYLFTIAVVWTALFGASAATLLRPGSRPRSRAEATADRGAGTAAGTAAAARTAAAAGTPVGAATGMLIAVAVLLACGGEAYAVYRLYRLGPPPVTTEGRDRLIAGQRPLYPAIAWLNRHAGTVTLYAVNAELMVDYASGTLLGDYNGPASFERMEARARTTGSVASALDAVGASHLLVPVDAPFWTEAASRDPRLTRIYDDGHAVIYQRRK